MLLGSQTQKHIILFEVPCGLYAKDFFSAGIKD